MTDRFEDYLRGFEPAGLRRDLAATIGAARLGPVQGSRWRV